MILPPLIAHRAAAALAPENTLAAIRRAKAAGAAMVEVDVRLSRDGRPVLFHDDRLERTSSGHGPVAEWDWADLARLDAGDWFDPAFAGEPIPLLDQALALCAQLGLAINLELKPDRGRDDLTAQIALRHAAACWPQTLPPPLISSFSGAALETARKIVDDWPRGLLIEQVDDCTVGLAQGLGCSLVIADHRGLDAGLVVKLLQSGVGVVAYTVNDAARMRILRHYGVMAIISDYPSAS